MFKESADLVKTEILFHAAGAAQLKARSQVIVRVRGTVSRSMSDERRFLVQGLLTKSSAR